LPDAINPIQSQIYLLRIWPEIGPGFSRLRELREVEWGGLCQLITGGAQLNGLAGWQGFQPVPTPATVTGTLLVVEYIILGTPIHVP